MIQDLKKHIGVYGLFRILELQPFTFLDFILFEMVIAIKKVSHIQDLVILLWSPHALAPSGATQFFTSPSPGAMLWHFAIAVKEIKRSDRRDGALWTLNDNEYRSALSSLRTTRRSSNS